MILAFVFIVGTVSGLIMIAYEDNVPFALYKKLRCRMGWHKIRTKIGRTKVHAYYCRFCKKPRKFPVLKLVDGGNKIRDDGYKF